MPQHYNDLCLAGLAGRAGLAGLARQARPELGTSQPQLVLYFLSELSFNPSEPTEVQMQNYQF